MKSVWFYNFPVGTTGIAEEDGALSRVFLARDKHGKDFEVRETPLLKKAAAQLAEYFNGTRGAFDLPLAPRGTEFQLKVWRALQTIPAGLTRSYGDIAVQIGRAKACRAVGMANNRNPLLIIIPCHRVIGKDKTLTGYAAGLSVKKYLLELETVYA
ncbi:MAG: methylated-DNA--[protein]-cysteine S-methyltransferase [Treponema sp.]|jgi:methylated-DNA-[protein]-cysteine S-methyltransferase|nr:methylated-DNA--[protein]-cysteine S-methyltransferase [Treponema sp.]